MLLDDYQQQLEQQSAIEGRDRYLRRQERIEADQGFGSRDDSLKFIQRCHPKLTKVISDYLQTGSNGKGKTQVSLSYLKDLEPELTAHLTLTSIFSSLGRGDHIQNTLTLLGRNVEAELWAKALEQYDEDLYGRLVHRATRAHGNVQYRKKAVRSTAAKEGFKIETWTDDVRANVAGPLLNLTLQAIPEVFVTELVVKGSQTLRYVRLTPEASDYFTGLSDLQSWMHPVFKPMVVKPTPWTAFDSGAYKSLSLSSRVPLMRTSQKERIAAVKAAIENGQMAPCLEALNAIQDTAWSINTKVLDVVRWCWDNGYTFGTFPRRNHIERPERPHDYDSLPAERQKGWRIKVSQIAERNRGIDSERITVLQDLAVAEELSGTSRFYIPHSLDFRGRVYPVPHFNQQRADHIKGMLQFAVGKPLGKDGAYWLSVHLANCGDFDKISKQPLDSRVQWVERNIELIKAVASDPKASRDVWTGADKPFQFLAACIDFVGFLENGERHVSHIPVALDGSNSGLQHYSASLRSLEGALVNLVPSEYPADIYQSVADLVAQSIKQEAAEGDELAALVLQQGISRSLVKRNVMTFAYSSGQFGFKQQLMSDLMQPLNVAVLEGLIDRNPYSVNDDGGFRAAGYIAGHTWRAVNTLVNQAADGMRFFQRCASALAHEKKGLQWMTPVGLPVIHRYDEYNYKRVKMFLYDKSVKVEEASTNDKVSEMGHVLKQVRLQIRTDPNGRIDKHKARNAVAPNVIHSLDAAHLMLTVLDAKDNGIESYSLIHDSFGTHAADTGAFFQLIRVAFVNMYDNYDPFEEVALNTYMALDDKSKVPELPTRGELDLHQVLESDYAFS